MDVNQSQLVCRLESVQRESVKTVWIVALCTTAQKGSLQLPVPEHLLLTCCELQSENTVCGIVCMKENC